MRDQAAVVDVCREVFCNLVMDSDVIDYIAAGVLDDGSLLPSEDFADFVLPLIQDSCGDDLSAASDLALELHDRLSNAFGQPGEAAAQAASCKPGGKQLRSLFPEESLPPAALRSLFPEFAGCAGHALPDAAARQSDSRSKRHAAASKAEAKEVKALARQAGRCAAETARLDAELAAACEHAARLRAAEGARRNAVIKIGPFDLPHPGGCGNLLENAEFSLTPGRRYALIGRNGKGKSTLLRCLAARRVAGLPAAVRVHYVSQDVSFSSVELENTPAEVVVDADVERRLLLAKAKDLEAVSVRDSDQYKSVLDELQAIGADSAESRAVQMLSSLGVSEELRSRPLKSLRRLARACGLGGRPLCAAGPPHAR